MSIEPQSHLCLGISNFIGHYTRTLAGHRAAYLKFGIERLGGTRITGFSLITHKSPVLWLMVEDNFGLFVASSLARALLGRRTVGLLFRPKPAAYGKTLRLRIKRLALRALRPISKIQTLSIIPTTLELGIAPIVDGWVHDFHFWDLSQHQLKRITTMRNTGECVDPESWSIFNQCRAHANGRPLLVALGVQSHLKGTKILAATMREGGTKGWAVLVAGQFERGLEYVRLEIEAQGGMVINRYLTDSEMEAAYAAATAIWCLYDPDYDQSSGILGRAAQLRIPAVVRMGSISEALCVKEGLAHIASRGGKDLAVALTHLPRSPNSLIMSDHIARESLRTLRNALGFQSSELA